MITVSDDWLLGHKTKSGDFVVNAIASTNEEVYVVCKTSRFELPWLSAEYVGSDSLENIRHFRSRKAARMDMFRRAESSFSNDLSSVSWTTEGAELREDLWKDDRGR